MTSELALFLLDRIAEEERSALWLEDPAQRRKITDHWGETRSLVFWNDNGVRRCVLRQIAKEFASHPAWRVEWR